MSDATEKVNDSTSSYSMPAEWSAHSCCLLLYPHNESTFRLDLARLEVLEIARTIATTGNEHVHLFCCNQQQADELQQQAALDQQLLNNITVQVCPSDDTWARDTGPTFTVSSSSNNKLLRGIDWDFNAYGGPDEGCYWPCDVDRQVAAQMCRVLSTNPNNNNPHTIPTIQVPLVLEGGSIHTDGQGTILTTAECLLHPNRNPTMSRNEIKELVLQATGCTKMIWLPTGLAFDHDTNGHVDNFCCFVQPAVVVLAWTDDANNDAENYNKCRDALKVLESETDAVGRHLTVHKLYLPSPIVYSKEEADSLQTMTLADGTKVAPRQVGERMAGSYVNFYIANEAVVVPQFGDPAADAKAIATLTPLFPGRQVVGVPSREVLIGGGNIHCITQQVPAVHNQST